MYQNDLPKLQYYQPPTPICGGVLLILHCKPYDDLHLTFQSKPFLKYRP